LVIIGAVREVELAEDAVHVLFHRGLGNPDLPGDPPFERPSAINARTSRSRALRAVRHAQAAQDWERAGRLLADHWLDLTLNGQAATAHQKRRCPRTGASISGSRWPSCGSPSTTRADPEDHRRAGR
jgi:hypothetical protein